MFVYPFSSLSAFLSANIPRGLYIGDALCSDDDAVSAGGKGLWSGSGGTEDGFLLSRPVEKVDW